MKAINFAKNLIAITVATSFGASANGYIIPHQTGIPEYNASATGIMVTGDYQINGTSLEVKVINIGQMGDDLEQVKSQATNQLDINKQVATEIAAANDLAVNANTNASDALKAANSAKNDIKNIQTAANDADNKAQQALEKADQVGQNLTEFENAILGVVGIGSDAVDADGNKITVKGELDKVNTATATAQDTANAAKADASNALDIAQEAKNAAASIASDVDTAKTNAINAASTAEAANELAGIAASAAATADSKADEALSVAQTAVNDASTANIKADNALNQANAANAAAAAVDTKVDQAIHENGLLTDRVNATETSITDINNRLDSISIAGVDLTDVNAGIAANTTAAATASVKADAAQTTATAAHDLATSANQTAATAAAQAAAATDKVNSIDFDNLATHDHIATAVSGAVAGKADQSSVDVAHQTLGDINQILHGAPSTLATDSTGDIGLIAKVDQNSTDIAVVTNQVSNIVTSVNDAANQAAAAVTKVDSVDVKASIADSKATLAVAKATTAQATANAAQTTAQSASQKADAANSTAQTAHSVAMTASSVAYSAHERIDQTNQVVSGFDGRITSVESDVKSMNKSFANLKNQVDKNHKQAKGGIAGVAAMASIPTIAGEKFSLGAGVGGFDGASAVAIGGTYNVNSRVALKMNVATTTSTEVTYGAGVAFGF